MRPVPPTYDILNYGITDAQFLDFNEKMQKEQVKEKQQEKLIAEQD